MRMILALLLFATVTPALAASDSLRLQPTQIDALNSLAPGAHLLVADFPDGSGKRSDIHFEHIDVYATGARIIAVTAAGVHDIARSRRVQLIGFDDAGDVRVHLAFDPGMANVSGSGFSPSGPFAITAHASGNDVVLDIMPADQALPANVAPEFLGGEDSLPGLSSGTDALTLALAPQAIPASPRAAIVAVDTDNEFMAERFTNNTSDATDWIADLFGAMNVMYQRDLNVTLLQGTTYLRTTPDPYSQSATPANSADLDEFGTYWQTHYSTIPRSFAMLLSGKASSGNFASGIAWINAYCKYQSQSGSYSVNQIFTNSDIAVSYSALIVGHELGHNFGAYHTHCTDVSTGGAPTANNTIDQCYNGDSGGGCYNGPVSCPVSGPGHPMGSLMSYCNTSPPHGAACGQNVLQFHPTQVGVLNALIAQNTPSCLAPNADNIFANGFD